MTDEIKRLKKKRVNGEMSQSKVSAHYQGTPEEVAQRMSRNSAFKRGMEKYYGMTLDENGVLIKKDK